jgi:clan AA aspartic protease
MSVILGSVHSNGDAIVELTVRATAHDRAMVVRAAIDTGFNDYLTLPTSAIEALGLRFREETRYTLGDGSEVVSRVYHAELAWGNAWRHIVVTEIAAQPLLGMATLYGWRLIMDVIDGGAVSVETLASP